MDSKTAMGSEPHGSPVRPDFERIALLLQGGGALGSYQAGVYQALAEANLHPHWVAGISIGAINSALIAGNPPERRVERLRQFWETVTESPFGSAASLFKGDIQNNLVHQFVNQGGALSALLWGAPSFFKPRIPPPIFMPVSSPGKLSFYDVSPLKTLLGQLVDFDRLNSGEMRVSVGAVNVRSGNFVYFDTAERKLGPEHFMASGALPPGFPAVEIDGEFYWDGGVVSNTPLSYVLSTEPRRDTLTFQVDLWSAKGRMPDDLMEVSSRQKDIQYSSRTRAITTYMMQMQKMRQALQIVMEKLPEDAKKDPAIKAIADLACHRAYNIVHLIYQTKAYEGHSKDFEFGLDAMRDHWQSGLDDIRRTLADPHRLDRPTASEDGVVSHDVHRQDR